MRSTPRRTVCGSGGTCPAFPPAGRVTEPEQGEAVRPGTPPPTSTQSPVKYHALSLRRRRSVGGLGRFGGVDRVQDLAEELERLSSGEEAALDVERRCTLRPRSRRTLRVRLHGGPRGGRRET